MPTPRIVRFAALTATLVPGLALSAQANAKATTTVKSAAPPAMAVIRRTELERDLYAMAGDGMRGQRPYKLPEGVDMNQSVTCTRRGHN